MIVSSLPRWCSAAVLVHAAACGGDVVVDPEPLVCEAPPPVGHLLSCHGAVAVDEGTITCSNLCLDEEAHEYLSLCAARRCECWYGGARVCECDWSSEQTSCTPDSTCCPSPWL